jgi:hypothetical protein
MSWVSVETISLIPSATGQLEMDQVENLIDSLTVSRSYNGIIHYRLSDVEREIRQITDNGRDVIDFIRTNAVAMANGRNGQMNGRNGQMNGRNGQMNGRNGQMNGIDYFPRGCETIYNGQRNGEINGQRNGEMNGRNGRNGEINGQRNGEMNGSEMWNGRNGEINGIFNEYGDDKVHVIMDTETFLKMVGASPSTYQR